MGRPRLEHITAEELHKLGALQCTQTEIAAWFDVSLATIEKRLAQEPKLREAYERGKAKGRISVRRHQIKLLEEGNPTMGIWLGKQLLGQRDVTAMEVSGPQAGPVESKMQITVTYTDAN